MRRLLHDEALDPADRVAGLLILLFAQPLARITRLRIDHIVNGHRQVAFALGSQPVQLPPPVDELVLELRQRRHGHAAVGHTNEHPWLFPGGRPGRPLSSNQLLRRMKAIGIPARSARNTTLLELAAEMPAVVLSKLLGISPSTATRWTEYAGASAAGYAADLARRANRRRH